MTEAELKAVPTVRQAALRTMVEELLMRVAPDRLTPDNRETAICLLERDLGELLGVVQELAESLECTSQVNLWSGSFCTVVDPEWFSRFKQVTLHFTGLEVLREVPISVARPEKRTLQVVG